MSAVRARDLEIGRDAFRLAVGDFDLEAGETLAVVGPSGCGKTTLLHTLGGILVPLAGRLTVDDADLSPGGELAGDETARRRFRRERLGLVFQEFELLAHLSARENALVATLLHPELARGAAEAPAAALDRLSSGLGIAGLLDRIPGRLSQGERQRVALLRALLLSPKLILADEPTGNLDPARGREALELMLEKVRDEGAALVMVTHDLSLTGRFDRVLELA